MKEQLAQRKEQKGKKPSFIQQDSHKKKRVAQKWRKPRGRHSKLRLHIRGYKRWPCTGWRSPRSVKGLHTSGLEIVVVHNLTELGKIDGTKQGVVIGSAVGAKNRIPLIEVTQAKNITLLNIKDIDTYKKQLQDTFNARKERNAKKTKKKEEKKTEEKKKEEKKTEEKKKEEKKTKTIEKKVEESEDVKKEMEKKEKDKLLTKAR